MPLFSLASISGSTALTVTVSESIPTSAISSAFSFSSSPLVLMHFTICGYLSFISLKVCRAYGDANVSPGPAIPATFRSLHSSRALPVASTASSGVIMVDATPGLFSFLFMLLMQNAHSMLQAALVGRCILPVFPALPLAKHGCFFVSSS